MAKARASRANRSNKRSTKRTKRSTKRTAKRRHRGGALSLSPADVSDATMFGPSSQSSAQGTDYARIHQGQHGGASLAAAAPVGDQGLLDPSLRSSAHLAGLDAAVTAASGMRDQAGGARKKTMSKRFRNLYKATKRSVKKGLSMKRFRNLYKATKRSVKKGLSMKRFRSLFKAKRGGGSYQYANQGDYSAPGTLLPPSMEAKALAGMHPDWALVSK